MSSLLDPPAGKPVYPIINADVNASKRDYDNLQDGQLLLFSTFYTIQGEGPYGGRPALFVRLSGCNIGLKQDCPWCDTKFHLKDGRVVSGHDAIMHELAQHASCRLVVLTGGEPLLQWQRLKQTMAKVDPHFGALGGRLTWQFETNGLLLREDMIDCARRHGHIKFVCSPKVPHNRTTYPAIPEFWGRAADVLDLKYVVTADEDSPYYDVPEDALSGANEVYISGMTVYKRAPHPGEIANVWDDTLIDRKETARNYKHAAKLALEYGRPVSYQTHLFGGVE